MALPSGVRVRTLEREPGSGFCSSRPIPSRRRILSATIGSWETSSNRSIFLHFPRSPMYISNETTYLFSRSSDAGYGEGFPFMIGHCGKRINRFLDEILEEYNGNLPENMDEGQKRAAEILFQNIKDASFADKQKIKEYQKECMEEYTRRLNNALNKWAANELSPALVDKELKKLRETPLSEARLRAAKKQIQGQLAIASENKESQALSMGKSLLYFDHFESVENALAKIEALTAKQLQEVAKEVFNPETMSLLVYGENNENI